MFDKLYNTFTEVEQRDFMRAFIERIDIYPEKPDNGCWIRNIVFNFPKDFTGKVIAVYHRYDDNETKWIVVPCGEDGNIQSSIKMPDKNEIYAQIAFQEQFYSGVLVGL